MRFTITILLGYDGSLFILLSLNLIVKTEGKMTVILGELGGKPTFSLGPIYCQSLLTLKDRTLTAEQPTCGIRLIFLFRFNRGDRPEPF